MAADTKISVLDQVLNEPVGVLAGAALREFVVSFYDPTRRHSTLGYVSPIEFEKAQEA